MRTFVKSFRVFRNSSKFVCFIQMNWFVVVFSLFFFFCHGFMKCVCMWMCMCVWMCACVNSRACVKYWVDFSNSTSCLPFSGCILIVWEIRKIFKLNFICVFIIFFSNNWQYITKYAHVFVIVFTFPVVFKFFFK